MHLSSELLSADIILDKILTDSNPNIIGEGSYGTVYLIDFQSS